MSGTLLVCYSRTGYTESLAREIVGMTGWDLEIITDQHSRDGNWGFLRSILEVLLHLKPAIRGGERDPSGYELVVAAAPVWMRRLASPMRSYLTRHRGRIKTLAFVCTYGGSGAEATAAQAAGIASARLAGMLAVTSQELEQADYRARLDAFLAGLHRA